MLEAKVSMAKKEDTQKAIKVLNHTALLPPQRKRLRSKARLFKDLEMSVSKFKDTKALTHIDAEVRFVVGMGARLSKPANRLKNRHLSE